MRLNLASLLAAVNHRHVQPPEASACCWPPRSDTGQPAPQPSAWSESWSDPWPEPVHYSHRDERRGINFQVRKLPFAALQVIEPRLVRIAPASSNERHRHAHESLFVVLAGVGEILIDRESAPLLAGSVAYVPRWVVHQSQNHSDSEPLVLLAITDFGLTSAVLGDYDARTRLRGGGSDALADEPSLGPAPPDAP